MAVYGRRCLYDRSANFPGVTHSGHDQPGIEGVIQRPTYGAIVGCQDLVANLRLRERREHRNRLRRGKLQIVADAALPVRRLADERALRLRVTALCKIT